MKNTHNFLNHSIGSNQQIFPTTKTLPNQETTTPVPNNPVGPSANPTTPRKPQTPRKPTRPRILTIPPTAAPTQAPRITRPPTRAVTRPPVVVLRTTQEPRVTERPTTEANRPTRRLSTILFPTVETDGDNDIHGMSKPAEIIRGPENMRKNSKNY